MERLVFDMCQMRGLNVRGEAMKAIVAALKKPPLDANPRDAVDRLISNVKVIWRRVKEGLRRVVDGAS